METFADYILSEHDCTKKMEIVYYLKKRAGIFFNTSVVLKTELAKLFIEKMNLDVDRNLVLTACLLYACKKNDNPQDLEKIKLYPKESAEYLKTLGFTDEFCRICRQHNRYEQAGERTKEGDVLELVDQFGGMLMHRPERMGFKVDEALCLLEYRNLKDKNNIYIERFKEFITLMEEIKVEEVMV